ncbi:MAG: methylmalonyl-CoA mutase family protein [Hyphomicrobiaceae bacterium]
MLNPPRASDFPPASREAWEMLAQKGLGGARVSDLATQTLDGIRIEPIYAVSGLAPALADLVPGAAPFVRGALRTDEQGRPWRSLTLHADDDPNTTCTAIRDDLANGADGIVLHLAVPGLFGLAPRYDAIRSALEGVALAGTDLEVMAGDQFLGAAQSLAALWDAAGIADGRRFGAINADPLGTLAATGALEEGLWRSLDTLAHFAASNVDRMPNVRLLLADARPYHEAGASEAEELASLLATLVVYLKHLDEAGVRPDVALGRIGIALATDTDLFLSMAKLRAARGLVWRVMAAAGFGEATARLHLTCSTSARIMTRRSPNTNLLRTTIAATAAVLGGADCIAVLPYTWALGRPDGEARRLARNTLNILAEESHLGRVADPGGGSAYLETLTDALARKSWALFQEIEAKGGMTTALTSGSLADRIAVTAERRAKLVADGALPLVGVSVFPETDAPPPGVLPHPPVAAIERAETRIDTFAPRPLDTNIPEGKS